MRLAGVGKPKYVPALVIIVAVAVILAAFSFWIDRDAAGPEKDSEDVFAAGPVFPLPVSGYVNGSLGDPVSGALVTVKTFSGETAMATLTSTTDANGFFAVAFQSGEWDVGWTVVANATYGALWAEESVLIEVLTAEVFIELVFTVEIPEFSSLLLVVCATALVFVFASMRRRLPR